MIIHAVMHVTTYLQNQLWSKDSSGLDMLKSMKVVVFGGASLSKEIGNVLVEHDVNLTQFYSACVTFHLLISFIFAQLFMVASRLGA